MEWTGETPIYVPAYLLDAGGMDERIWILVCRGWLR